MQELMLAAALNLYSQQRQAELEAEAQRQRMAHSLKADAAPKAAPAIKRRPLLPRLAGALGLF